MVKHSRALALSAPHTFVYAALFFVHFPRELDTSTQSKTRSEIFAGRQFLSLATA